MKYHGEKDWDSCFCHSISASTESTTFFSLPSAFGAENMLRKGVDLGCVGCLILSFAVLCINFVQNVEKIL